MDKKKKELTEEEFRRDTLFLLFMLATLYLVEKITMGTPHYRISSLLFISIFHLGCWSWLTKDLIDL